MQVEVHIATPFSIPILLKSKVYQDEVFILVGALTDLKLFVTNLRRRSCNCSELSPGNFRICCVREKNSSSKISFVVGVSGLFFIHLKYTSSKVSIGYPDKLFKINFKSLGGYRTSGGTSLRICVSVGYVMQGFISDDGEKVVPLGR